MSLHLSVSWNGYRLMDGMVTVYEVLWYKPESYFVLPNGTRMIMRNI